MSQTQIVVRPVAFLAILMVVTAMRVWSADTPSVHSENELLEVLRSDSTTAEKAMACKLLTIHGSSTAIPNLAELLTDAQLASWARIALEAIPGHAADAALRNATPSLQGNLLIGAINSIGVRRDANAVDPLTAYLQDADDAVVSAAAVALGRIGNDAAAKSLRAALVSSTDTARSGIAEGCVLCAERLWASGHNSEAIDLYDLLRKETIPRQRLLEATRGAILARQQRGISLLIDQLQSPDKGLFQIALSTAREFPGHDVDQSLADEMARTTPARAALLIVAMADRQHTVKIAAILAAAITGEKSVRIAAIEALGRVGNTSCLSPLLDCAIENDADLQRVAKKSLADLPGESIDQDIAARLAKAEGQGPIYPLLIELIGQRRIDAFEALQRAAGDSDKVVRNAAFFSMGTTIPEDKLSVLIQEVISPKFPEDTSVTQLALKTASIRMPDREACAQQLAESVERASPLTKISLLQILGAMGGPTALEAIGVATKSNDPQLQDAGSRLLGEWMTIDGAPVLLDLAKTVSGEKYQVRAMRGYIRIARQFTMSEPERVEMCKKALEACRHPAEQKLVLDVLKRYPSMETLRLAIHALQLPELKSEASQATAAIAQKIGNKSREARDLIANVDFQKIKLEIVKAEYGAGTAQKDVTEVLQKLAVDSPLIPMPSESYNACFDGDPAPGIVKRLKIEFRINDATGGATFEEDAMIILPTPK